MVSKKIGIYLGQASITMKKSVSVRTWAILDRVKTAALKNSDSDPASRLQVIGKTLPGTITDMPRKGQKSMPTKHSDVPFELRKSLRRKNSASLAEAMRAAGGPTSAEGEAYAAVLEERGVNPNLAGVNMGMAKATPNDIYYNRNKK